MRDASRRAANALRIRFDDVERRGAEIGLLEPRMKLMPLRTIDVDLQEGLADGIDPIRESMPRLHIRCGPALARVSFRDGHHSVRPPDTCLAADTEPRAARA